MKRNILGLGAIVLALAFSAFTNTKKFDTSVFFNSTNISDIYDASKYQSSQGTLSCDGSITPCEFILPSPYTTFSAYKVAVLDNLSEPQKRQEYDSHVNSQKD